MGKIDSDFASACAEFAEKIEFVLTQPGRWVCDYFSFSDDGVGFWITMVVTSVLWGNVLAFIIKFVWGKIFR